VPTGATRNSEQEPFETTGNIACGYNALSDVFSEMVQRPNNVQERRQAQERYLKDYIEDSVEDSWGAAVKLVTEALNESASHKG